MRPASTSLRERKKAETRDALVKAAFTLFLARGFEAVTVDDIAASSEVSRSTFFRYFQTKEAVVFPFQPERMRRFHELLGVGRAGESNLDTVRRACFEIAQEFVDNRQLGVLQNRIIRSSPLLIAKESEIDYGWEVGIADALARSGMDAWRARVAAAAIFGAVRTTVRTWLESDGQGDLLAQGRDAFEMLREGLPFGA